MSFHGWRSNAPPPAVTPEKLIEMFRLDAEREAKPPRPIYVSRDVFNEWVRLGLIDESGKLLAKEPSV